MRQIRKCFDEMNRIIIGPECIDQSFHSPVVVIQNMEFSAVPLNRSPEIISVSVFGVGDLLTLPIHFKIRYSGLGPYEFDDIAPFIFFCAAAEQQ